MNRTLILAALAALLLTPTVRAQQSAGKAAVSDPLFAAAAASGGLAEVSISELGLRKATDAELKRFSQQMVADHTQMNGELTALAARKGIALPRTPDARAQFCAQSLAGVSGEEFDKCYAKAQCLLHKDSVAMFEAEAERGQDPDMKALAAKALPRIKEHLKMIEPIAKRYESQESGSDRPATGKSNQQ
jgi:putative membrane protein